MKVSVKLVKHLCFEVEFAYDLVEICIQSVLIPSAIIVNWFRCHSKLSQKLSNILKGGLSFNDFASAT